MNKQTKKTSIILLIGGFLFLALAVFLLASNGQYMITGKALEINDLLLANTLEAHRGDYVRVSVDAVIENYAETKHTTNGIPTGTDQHFVIWLDDDSIISAAVPGSKADGMNRVMEETWAYLNDEADSLTTNPVVIEGELTSIGGELKDFYDEAVEYYGLDSKLEVRYYQIDTTNPRWMLILEELLFLVLGGFLVFLFFNGKKAEKKAAAEAAAAPGYTYQPGAESAAATPGYVYQPGTESAAAAFDGSSAAAAGPGASAIDDSSLSAPTPDAAAFDDPSLSAPTPDAATFDDIAKPAADPAANPDDPFAAYDKDPFENH